MVNNSSDFNQHDPKVFKETLGSFGTTTNPMGGNQLAQLQTAVRQGVKHVELHLSSAGKGQFGTSDVPDKYGFEQRRTIMQLAKLNEQTLSVHGTFQINSFSGLAQNGFNEVQRANNMKEIDETLKFAAETAKQGAVVFHLHETGLPPGSPGELNLPEWYLKKLQKENPDEYKNIMDRYLNKDDLDRQFVENPDLEAELKVNYEHLDDAEKKRLKDNLGVSNWKDYYEYNKNEQIKLEQEGTPLVVVGNSITRAQRGQDIINLEGLNSLNDSEKSFLESQGIITNPDDFTIDDFQKIQAKLSNGKPTGISDSEYKTLRKKLVVEYKDVLAKNYGMKSKSDKEYFQKSLDMQIQMAKLQKKDFELNYIINEDYLEQINELTNKERKVAMELKKASSQGDVEKVKKLKMELHGGISPEDEMELHQITEKYQSGNITDEELKRAREIQANASGIAREKLELMHKVGQIEYQKLEKYDEYTSQLNEQIKKAREQKENAKVMTDEIFEKNASAMGHLGLKSLRYQLDLKKKAETSQEKLNDFTQKISQKEKEFENCTDASKRSKLNNELQKLKYDKRLLVGMSDYEDIDVINKPLYISPENMMAGYGYMDSLEEFKGVIRTSWEDFAKKLMSNEDTYKKIREDYEKETGIKVNSLEKAKEVAKRHIGGTFDNAHAGVWLKYFKREKGESEEHRVERFNKWLNNEAESMAKEGIIKHVHFNDTTGKDDDHNLLGSGILDIFDLREKLRGAGIKESLIVEAGGRGTNSMMHVLNAFDIFNPTLSVSAESAEKGYGATSTGSSPSDWISTKREYQQRPQYSAYGMNPNSFNAQVQPQQGLPRGGWSGTGFF